MENYYFIMEIESYLIFRKNTSALTILSSSYNYFDNTCTRAAMYAMLQNKYSLGKTNKLQKRRGK